MSRFNLPEWRVVVGELWWISRRESVVSGSVWTEGSSLVVAGIPPTLSRKPTRDGGIPLPLGRVIVGPRSSRPEITLVGIGVFYVLVIIVRLVGAKTRTSQRQRTFSNCTRPYAMVKDKQYKPKIYIHIYIKYAVRQESLRTYQTGVSAKATTLILSKLDSVLWEENTTAVLFCTWEKLAALEICIDIEDSKDQPHI